MFLLLAGLWESAGGLIIQNLVPAMGSSYQLEPIAANASTFAQVSKNLDCLTATYKKARKLWTHLGPSLTDSHNSQSADTKVCR